MRIALYGYGKMGKAIEAIAIARGHQVLLRVDSHNQGTPPTGADVAIEFSTPENAMANMKLCLEHGVPMVVGTTGWYDHLDEIKVLVSKKKGSLLWASNFSIGVNLFFRVNRLLAALMDQQAQYAVHIDESHHVHKLDAPSGTAITLARDIDMRTGRYSGIELTEHSAQDLVASGPVPIRSERIGEVPGTHTVSWTSANDRIVLTHEAFGRTGFAQGAVVAAEWIQGKQGFFSMDDVLNVN